MKIKISIAFVILALATVTSSCLYEKEDKLAPAAAPCVTTAVSYKNDLKPILAKSCTISGCHNAVNQSAGLNLETLSGLKDHTDHLINTLTGANGESLMPASGKLDDCSIDKFRQWIAQGEKDN